MPTFNDTYDLWLKLGRSRMNETVFIEHLRHRRNGRGICAQTTGTETQYLAPDGAVAGRFIKTGGVQSGDCTIETSARDDFIWIPPQPTTASRIPPKRTRGHFRGIDVDPGDNRRKVIESTLERDLLLILMASRYVARVDDQPPAVRYITDDGWRAHHIFDFRAILENGCSVAYAVKPQRKVESRGLGRTVDLIRHQSLAGFADRAVIRTERQITRRRVFNADEILRARRMRKQTDITAARKVVERLYGSVRLDDLVEQIALGSRGRNAVICLVDEGVLALDQSAWIAPDTRVRPA